MTVLNNNFDEVVFGRRSVKEFDVNVKISNEELLEILNKTVTAPSSINMQPWRFVVVSSPEGKEKLTPLVSFNQRQNNTSAAMIVIFGDTKCQEFGEEIYSKAVELGYMPQAVKEQILPSFVGMYDKFSKEMMESIVKIDGSLAAMQLMLVARTYGYDTNAIGGFNQRDIAETLGLEKERYVPVMIVAIGKAAKEGRQTYRLPAEDITTFL